MIREDTNPGEAQFDTTTFEYLESMKDSEQGQGKSENSDEEGSFGDSDNEQDFEIGFSDKKLVNGQVRKLSVFAGSAPKKKPQIQNKFDSQRDANGSISLAG